MIRTERQPPMASAVVWNTVVPALGLALILGAALLPAMVIAAAVSTVMYAALMPASHRRQRRIRLVPGVAERRAARAA